MSATVHLTLYKDAIIVLATAGIIVPIMHRLKVTPVLGYLAAGALLGPKGLGALAHAFPWIGAGTFESQEEIAGIAELGIVCLLFVIGLELSPERLFTMRRLVFGLGSLQVILTSLAVGLTAPFFGNALAASVLIGLSLALSSTAMVLDWLGRQKRLNSTMGRATFAVLLLQDLAVVPMLFLVGLLAADGTGSIGLGLILALAQGAAMLALIVVVGRLLLRPMFRMAASAGGGPELFMATTLLVAIGSGLLTAAAGMSMALGGFVAGLLLAETEYRRAIEAVIEPFKGLLLGVFFISVGTRIDVVAILSDPLYLMFCATGLIGLKALIQLMLGRLFGLTWSAAIEFALLLGPSGEFAFILIALGSASGIVPPDVAGLLLAVVALTMASIPLLGWLGQRIAAYLEPAAQPLTALQELPPEADGARAIVVGAGRVGKLISEMLTAHRVPHVLTDNEPAAVVAGRDVGLPTYYGDGKDLRFLDRCGIMEAKALIITINDRVQIDAIIDAAHTLRPNIDIIVRARDALHARHLYHRGVTDAVPETIEASLQLSEAALVALGVPTGPAIASIHDKRDMFRRELQEASGREERPIRGLRASARAYPDAEDR